jgi:hypothetical protein
MSSPFKLISALIVLMGGVGLPQAMSAQAVATGQAEGASVDPTRAELAIDRSAGLSSVLPDAPEITPRGAFVRSLVVPGWGHLWAGSPSRAAFYVSAQGATTWMLTKSVLRRRSAERFLGAERDDVERALRRSGIQSGDSIQVLVSADPRVRDREALVSIRSDQVEDWAALALFLTLLGATDALVAAHLSSVPEPLTFGFVAPAAAGGISLGVRVPVHGRR